MISCTVRFSLLSSQPPFALKKECPSICFCTSKEFAWGNPIYGLQVLLEELLPCYSACCAKPAWGSGFYWKGARHVCFQEPTAIFSLGLHMKDCSRKRDIVSTSEAGQSWVRPWKQARGGELLTHPVWTVQVRRRRQCAKPPRHKLITPVAHRALWWFPLPSNLKFAFHSGRTESLITCLRALRANAASKWRKRTCGNRDAIEHIHLHQII